MVRYFTIPLYDTEECINVVDNLYIPILSKEALIESANTNLDYTNVSGGIMNGYYPGTGKSSFGIPDILYSDFGIRNSGGVWTSVYPWNGPNLAPSTPAEFNLVKTKTKAAFSEIVFRACVNDDFTPDKFNMARLAMIADKEYFIKSSDGKKRSIEVAWSTDTSAITRARISLKVDDSEVLYDTYLVMCNYYTSNVSTGKSLLGYDRVKSLMIGSELSPDNCDYGVYIFPFLFDDMSGINYSSAHLVFGNYRTAKLISSKTNSDIRRAYGEGNWYRHVGRQSWSPPFQGFFYRFLGFQNNKTLEDNVSGVDGEIKDDDPYSPDSENSYPGGGDDKNPYPPDGESGKGTFDNTNDPIDFPSMPLWDATSTGFISMWNPTIGEISELYGFLWDSDIATTLKKLFLEPMDAIISLAFFPVDPVNFPDKRNVTIGHVDTEIQMYAVQKQFVDFDFGSIKLDEYYGAAWDYSPYTKVSIYLPYIGSQELDVDDVMNATLHLKYRIDLLSGMCVAMLKCTRSRDGLDAVVYTWQGNCGMQVPITAGSAREFINSIIQIGAMTGLALAQPAAGAINAAGHVGNEDYQNPSMGGQWVSPAMATYSALNVLGQKVHVQRGGRVDANAGVMSPQSAYLIIDRPISAIPKGWNEYAGYPSLKIKALSTQKGMTQVAYIKLNGLDATAEEITELDAILKGGVIL